MTIQEFFDKWAYEPCDYDGYDGDQCVDLVQFYNRDVVGAPPLIGNAVDIWDTYPRDYYDQIPNTLTGIPQLGDIVIWGRGIGQYGHIAIFQKGDVKNFISFDQNFPIGSFCHFQEHIYSDVLGWLRPKKVSTVTTVTVDGIKFEELVNKSTKYDAFKAAGYETIDILLQKWGELTNEKVELQKANQTLNNKIADLSASIQKDAVEDSDTMAKLIDAEHSRDSYKTDIETVVQALGCEYPPVSTALKAIDDLRKPQDTILKDRESLLDMLFNDFVYKRVPTYKSFFNRIWEKIKGR